MADENKMTSLAAAPVVENLFAPEIFADGAALISMGAGTVTVALTSIRWDNSVHPPVAKRVVISRLTLPISSACGLVAGLTDFLGQQGYPIVFPEQGKTLQ